jgi:hypothetical protein
MSTKVTESRSRNSPFYWGLGGIIHKPPRKFSLMVVIFCGEELQITWKSCDKTTGDNDFE